MNKYTVVWSQKSKKQLKKMDKTESLLIVDWVKRNLEGIENPRSIGRTLKGNLAGYWRYKVGDYRVIVLIDDEAVIIQVVSAGHRKEIYE